MTTIHTTSRPASPRTTLPEVTRRAAAATERAVAVLTLAFAADPAARWAYPDAVSYLAHWPAFIRAFAGGAFDHGTAYASGGGVALWLPPGAHPDEAALLTLIERSIPAADQEEFFAVLGQMDAYHPREPHWYLPLIGVEPARQGEGAGSALLADALARCDGEGLPAYLEATSPANRRLYERHGFEVVGTIQAGASPPIWPMLRAPRPSEGR